MGNSAEGQKRQSKLPITDYMVSGCIGSVRVISGNGLLESLVKFLPQM